MRITNTIALLGIFLSLLFFTGCSQNAQTLQDAQEEQEMQKIGAEKIATAENEIETAQTEILFIQGVLTEQVKDCGDYYCFKIMVFSSSKQGIIDSVQTINTNMPIELSKGFLINIYGEEKNGYYASSDNIITLTGEMQNV